MAGADPDLAILWAFLTKIQIRSLDNVTHSVFVKEILDGQHASSNVLVLYMDGRLSSEGLGREQKKPKGSVLKQCLQKTKC